MAKKAMTSLGVQAAETALLDSEGVTEASPLLHHDIAAGSVSDIRERSFWHRPVIVWIVLTVVLTFSSCGDQLIDFPRTRVYESVLCYQYYEKTDPSRLNFSRDVVGPGAIGGVDEMLCKVNQVQDELAVIMGYQRVFDGFPTILMTIPIGWLADRIGRRPLLLMAIFAYIGRVGWAQIVTWFWQSIPIHAVWASSTFNLLGGETVATALFLVVLTDVTDEAGRATAFFQAGAVVMVTSLVMPLLSAWLMRINPWIPFLGGTVAYIIAFLLCFLVPETLPEQQRLLDRAEVEYSERGPQILPRRASVVEKVREGISFLIDDWRVPISLFPFMIRIIVIAGASLLLQYLSKRYALTFSEATIIVSVRNCFNVILFMVILPSLSHYMTNVRGISGARKDLYLARISQACAAIGFLLFAVAPGILTATISLAISALGAGATLLAQSFLASLVKSNDIAKVYSLISLVDTLGAMIFAPVMAELFNIGLKHGGVWIGLPYQFLGGLCVIFTVIFCIVPPNKEKLNEVI